VLAFFSSLRLLLLFICHLKSNFRCMSLNLFYFQFNPEIKTYIFS
jgi:hypothetical protein